MVMMVMTAALVMVMVMLVIVAAALVMVVVMLVVVAAALVVVVMMLVIVVVMPVIVRMIVRMAVHVHRHVAVFVRMGVQVAGRAAAAGRTHSEFPPSQSPPPSSWKCESGERLSVRAGSVAFGRFGKRKTFGGSPGRVFESLDRMGSGIFVRRLSGEAARCVGLGRFVVLVVERLDDPRHLEFVPARSGHLIPPALGAGVAVAV